MYTAIMVTTPDEPFIAEALSSILTQTLPANELIVIVNGSQAVGCPLGTQVRRIAPDARVLEITRSGMAHALALGVSLAQNSMISFLDADDLWLPSKQSEQVSLLMENPDLDVTVGATVNFESQENGEMRYATPYVGRLFGACTFTRETFETHGGPDPEAEHFTWLYRWWSQAQNNGVVVSRTANPVLFRRLHEANGWRKENQIGRQQVLAELRRTIHERP